MINFMSAARKSRGRGTTAAGAMLALALGLAACGGGSFDREGAVEDFVDGGLTDVQANCAVDAMVEAFGEDKLAGDDDPSDEDLEIVGEIVGTCLAG